MSHADEHTDGYFDLCHHPSGWRGYFTFHGFSLSHSSQRLVAERVEGDRIVGAVSANEALTKVVRSLLDDPACRAVTLDIESNAIWIDIRDKDEWNALGSRFIRSMRDAYGLATLTRGSTVKEQRPWWKGLGEFLSSLCPRMTAVAT